MWPWLGLAVGIFCIVRGVADVRERRRLWGAAGIIAGLILILTPIPGGEIRLELPVSGQP